MALAWIIETNVFYGQYDVELKLADAIREMGYPVSVIDYKTIFDPDQIEAPTVNNLVFLGSLQIAKVLQRRPETAKSVWMDLPKYDCSYYYPRIGSVLLNQDYVFLPYGDLIRRKDSLFSTLGEDRALFIRPNGGDKLFSGKLIYQENWEKDVEYAGFLNGNPENLVLVAAPKQVVDEWRFFVVDGRIVTGSQYYNRKVLEYIESTPNDVAWQYAESILADMWKPEDMFTLDICRTNHGEFYVLEIGCLSCSAQYASNIPSLITAVATFVGDMDHE